MPLRLRLLLSHVVIVAAFLLVIVFAAIVLLRDNPFQNSIVVQRLEFAAKTMARLSRVGIQSGISPDRIIRRLDQLDAANEVRLLFVDGASGSVLADSLGEPVGQVLLGGSSEARLTGEFDEKGARWLYAAAPVDPAERRRVLAVVATPAVRTPLLRDPVFVALMQPLLMAAAIALVIALILSALVTRSIVRPIQHVAAAADAMANGDLQHRAPLEGPVEVRDLATNFNTMAERVRASQLSQRDFLANVSHELKTPLTSVRGFAQAISDGAAGDAESVRRSAEIIREEADRMARMVGDLLDLSRIETGQMVMRRAPVSVADVLRGCVEKQSLRARSASVNLTADVPSVLPAIQGDGDRLAQVFTNLIDNALKHTPPGGKVAVLARVMSGSSVARKGKAWPGSVEISVSDTGAGIPAEDLSRIFERFYQVDKSRARGASGGSLGLGLAIVKEIVTAHGGSVHAESVTGLGTKFIVRLPLERG